MFLLLPDERRPTVNELSNQKGVVQKASGWKLYHMAAQIEDLVGAPCVTLKLGLKSPEHGLGINMGKSKLFLKV